MDQGWQVVEPLLNQVGQTLGPLVQSGWNWLQAQVVQSKIYTNNQTQINKVGQALQTVWSRLLYPFWTNGVQPIWAQGLAFLRPRLPEPLNTRLTDRGLTRLLLGLLVLLFWLISVLVPQPTPDLVQSLPAPIAVSTPSAPASPPTPPAPEQSSAPAPPAPEATEPEVDAQPVAVPPVPQAKILPRQAQVTEITAQYSPDLIDAIQASFEANQLMVQLNDHWYDLGPSEQDQVGNDVLRRSQNLDLQTVEFRDQQGVLVARNPVVGPHIIILRRHRMSPDST